MGQIKKILTRLKRWWKDFKKNHIINEVHPDDPNF